jgi:hypothetical protein
MPSLEKNSRKILFCAAVILLAFAHKLRPDIFDKSLLVLLLIAASPWLIPFLGVHLKSAELFGAKFEFLERQLKEQSDRIDALFLASMGNYAFVQLNKFELDKGFGPFTMSSAFARELSHLENLGYIQYRKRDGVNGLDDLWRIKQGSNLSDYIELTVSGKEFLDLRNSLEKTIAKPG